MRTLYWQKLTALGLSLVVNGLIIATVALLFSTSFAERAGLILAA